MSDEEDEEPYPRVWGRGDKCLAPYPEDDEYHPAYVKRVVHGEGGRMVVVVAYDGYPSEEEETVPIKKLRSRKRVKNITKRNENHGQTGASSTNKRKSAGSMFSPLRGTEQQQWLQEKYSSVDGMLGEGDRNSPRWRTTSSKRLADGLSRPESPSQRKAEVAIGGERKKKKPASRSSPSDSMIRPVEPQPSRPSTSSTHPSPSKSGIGLGFDDADLEKPKLSHTPIGPRTPLVLSDDGAVQVPGLINQYLRDYQRDGIRFLYSHFAKDQGGLLGDDMGLGKTVQVIGFVSAILGKTGTKTDILRQTPKFIRQLSDPTIPDDDGPKQTILIIGPASVLYNWVDELETWGHFTVGRYHQTHKTQTLADLKKGKLDVVITTFETCRDNIDQLNQFEWTAVIADEAHRIKGLKAETTRAIRKLNCRRRFGLTGTALQNHLLELWCVLDWCQPGCLGHQKEFRSGVARVIECGQKHDATKRELAEARKAKDKLAKLRSKWMIRRTKALIADQLPQKSEHVVYCRPALLQLRIYKAILAHPQMRLVLTQNQPCDCNSGHTRGKCCHRKTSDGQHVSAITLTFMHLLSKAANHVGLLIPGRSASEKQENKAQEICQAAFASHPEFLQQSREAAYRTLSNPKYCGKMKVLQGLLSVMNKERSKVLLFSLSTQLLDILEQYVVCTGYEYRRLDGATPNIRRMQLVREFNHDPNIFLFLISTRAGGVGLNLTGANVVIIFDPNWNPSHDLQAQDRAYRLGQGRDVRVYRLISSGTIEENIYLRQVYKQQLDTVAVADTNAKRLFHGVQGDKRNQGELFGIENMFKLREGDTCLTSDILQRHTKMVHTIRGFDMQEYIPPSVKQSVSEEEEDEEDEEEKENEEEDSDIDNSDIKRKADRDHVYGLDHVLCEVLSSEEASQESGELANDLPFSSTSGKERRTKQRGGSPQTPDSPQPSTSTGRGKQNKKQIKHRRSGTPPSVLKKAKRPHFGEAIRDPSDEESPRKKKRPTAVREKSRHVSWNCPESADKGPVSTFQVDQTVPTTFESVSDVFRDCGVIHLHDNRRVVAASRAEDHVSRCAVQDVFELHQNSQDPALNCDPLSDSFASDESEDLGMANREAIRKKKVFTKTKSPNKKQSVKRKSGKVFDPSAPRIEMVGSKKVLIGQTPPGIVRQHFERMVRSGRFGNALTLAEHVIRSSKQQREAMVREFYCVEMPDLEPVFSRDNAAVTPSGSKRGGKTRKGRTGGSKKTSPVSPPVSPRKRKVVRSPAKGCHYESDTESEEDVPESREAPATTASRVQEETNSVRQPHHKRTASRVVEPSNILTLGITNPTLDNDVSDILESITSPCKRAPPQKRSAASAFVETSITLENAEGVTRNRISSSDKLAGKKRHDTSAAKSPAKQSVPVIESLIEDVMLPPKQRSPRKRSAASGFSETNSALRTPQGISGNRSSASERSSGRKSHDISAFKSPSKQSVPLTESLLDDFLGGSRRSPSKRPPPRNLGPSLSEAPAPTATTSFARPLSKAVRATRSSESKAKSEEPAKTVTQESSGGLNELFRDFFGDDF